MALSRRGTQLVFNGQDKPQIRRMTYAQSPRQQGVKAIFKRHEKAASAWRTRQPQSDSQPPNTSARGLSKGRNQTDK